ncbi:MAG: HAD family hydrolase [Candidatus Magasanikbacteria bacterium]|nr:HAD family hydrolase [Candidatus Magasanikbacteria bacterium]
MYKVVIFDFEGTVVHGKKVYDDARELIYKLHSSGILLGIASNTSNVSIIERLEKNDLLQYFDTIVGIDQVDYIGKPAPDMFLRVCENVGVDVQDCVVIEDSVTGVEGATAAGMSAILVRGATHADALYVCKDLHDEELNRILFL